MENNYCPCCGRELPADFSPNSKQPTSDSAEAADYQLPGLDLLDAPNPADAPVVTPEELLQVQATVIEALADFGIAVSPGDISCGHTFTRYELRPAKGVRVDKIVSLERDIARVTCAEQINILAPVPGKDTVGIEIPNRRKQEVTLRELLESEDWLHTDASIPLATGMDVLGNVIIGDLARMPHLIIAGNTGSGKSVCINSFIASILYRFTPDQLRFVMIDPKMVEMQIYNTLPQLIIPVVTDPKKALLALRWVTDEMEKRHKIFAKAGVRNIARFNARTNSLRHGDDETPAPVGTMSYIVVIINELSDLMQTVPSEVEDAIGRITQMGHVVGIHMIIATQTPRADVMTGVIKANIPSRIAFQVSSGLDSRIILDEKGAERLLGQGDMLYQPPGTARISRIQGVLATDDEIHRLVQFVSAQSTADFESETYERLSGEGAEAEELSEEDEELVQKCIEIMKQERQASTSLFQRRLRLGYTRAARVVDILEARGYVAAGEGAKPREILVDLDGLIS